LRVERSFTKAKKGAIIDVELKKRVPNGCPFFVLTEPFYESKIIKKTETNQGIASYSHGSYLFSDCFV
jgi:hypothetical protein